MTKQLVFGILGGLFVVSFMSFMNTSFAQYNYGSGVGLTGSNSTNTESSALGQNAAAAITAPGIPNTGLGGSASMNLLQMGVASLFVLGGLRLAYKSILFRNSRRRFKTNRIS